MTVWNREISAALSEAISYANVKVNDRLAVELLKLGPVPIECFSQWVPPKPFITALKSQNLPLRYQEQILHRLANEEEQEARLTVAEFVATPVSLLEVLVGDEDAAVRLSAQYHPNCPAALVELITNQQQIAADPTTDAEQLTQLGQSRWGWIRQTVAQNPATPQDILRSLAAEPIDSIREAIAHNPSASATVLAQLLAQPAEDIKKLIGIVAAHPNTSDELLKEISQDERYRNIILQRNPLSESMFSFLLEQMTEQSDEPLWREDARMRRSERGRLVYTMRKNPSTPRWIIDQLADFELSDIRTLAKEEHKKSEPSQIERWTQEKFNECLAGLAGHPNASPSLLEAIAQKTDHIEVQAALAYNEKAPEELRFRAFEQLINSSGDRFVNKMAANPKTPVSVLEKIAQNCTNSEPGIRIIQTMLNGQATPHLLREIESFFGRHSDSARQILFWFRQDKAFSRPIIQDWAEMRSRLNGQEQKLLDLLSQLYLPAIGLSGSFPSSDVWVVDDPDALHLYGFLMLFDTRKQSRVTQRNWHDSLTLIGNPNLPAELRNSLMQLAFNGAEGNKEKIKKIHFALAFNASVSELERMKYFWLLMDDAYNRDIRQKLVESTETPVPILLKLIEESEKKDGVWQSAAKNPNTPIEYLEELAKDKNNTTVSYVRDNPGTPIKLLRKIVGAQDAGCYEWDAQPYGEVTQVRAYLGEAAYYQRQLAVQEINRLRVAKQKLFARENNPYAIAQALKNNDVHTKQLAARNRHMPSQVIDAIAQDEDPALRRAVVGHPNLSETHLLMLAQDKDASIHQAIAQSRQPLSKAVTQRLMDSNNLRVFSALSKRTDLSEELLDKLASHDHKDVKINALANPKTSAQALQRELPQITNEKTIERILRGKNNRHETNLNMPPILLEHYSGSDNRTIRFLVAGHQKANVETLERLAFDEYPLVRKTVAENPTTPCDVLIRMAEQAKVTTNTGSYHTVSNHICRRKDAPAEALDNIVRQSTSSVRLSAVANANLSAETLGWLAENETDSRVLKGIVMHPNVKADTLAILAESKSDAVRAAISALPNCPPQLLLLELLTQTPSVEVCANIAANPNTPASNLDLFITSEKTALRVAVASNPSLSPEQLTQLATDSSIEVKRAVANNSSTPGAVQRSLQQMLSKQAKRENSQPTSPTLESLPRLFDSTKDILPELLADYYESENDFVRFVVLLNPQTPVEVLEEGGRSSVWLERYAVAENSATPAALRQQLTQDEHDLVATVAQAVAV